MVNFHQVEGVLENDLYQSRGKSDNLGLNEEEKRGYFWNEYLNEDESINTNVF